MDRGRGGDGVGVGCCGRGGVRGAEEGIRTALCIRCYQHKTFTRCASASLLLKSMRHPRRLEVRDIDVTVFITRYKAAHISGRAELGGRYHAVSR